MSSMININFPNSESTLTSPFRFFTEMANHDIIGLAQKSFQNKLPNTTENNPFNKFAHKIEQDKLSFTVEYYVDNAGYVDEFGNWVKSPSNNSAFKTYTFKEELAKYLNSEYLNSKQFITDKWDNKGFDKDSKRWFENILVQLLRCISSHESTHKKSEYLNELVKPYEAIIRFIYEAYPSYVPPSNFDEKITDILLNSRNRELVYVPNTLNTNVYRKIVELSSDDTTLLFDFTDKEMVVKKFASFGAKVFDEISEPIQFNKNIEAAYYLIWRLATILSIKTKDISSHSIFSFSGKPFSTTAYYKNISIIKNSKPTLRRHIDLLIDSSLS